MGSTLAITLRPNVIEDVIGHADIIKTIQTKLDKGDVPRFWMFTGPYGTGKTTLAKIVARMVQGPLFSGEPQVQEINAAKMTGVDAMRDLVDTADMFPMVGTYKIIILDEAHKLSKPAQDLLLKPLEDGTQPTVWFVCTTDGDKILPGISDRAFKFTLKGMDAGARTLLISRAAAETKFTGDVLPFADAITKAGITSPRSILAAFETFSNGMPIAEAISTVSHASSPEYFKIAMAVTNGDWNGSAALLTALEAKLKGKAKDDDEPTTESEQDEPEGKPAAARGLRAVTAAFLKGKILKGNAKAAEAMHILAHCAPPCPFDTALEYPATISGLYRVAMRMKG